jgi:hypothetical protein
MCIHKYIYIYIYIYIYRYRYRIIVMCIYIHITIYKLCISTCVKQCVCCRVALKHIPNRNAATARGEVGWAEFGKNIARYCDALSTSLYWSHIRALTIDANTAVVHDRLVGTTPRRLRRHDASSAHVCNPQASQACVAYGHQHIARFQVPVHHQRVVHVGQAAGKLCCKYKGY